MTEGLRVRHDHDFQETHEWREAFLAVLEQAGPDRARFLLNELTALAQSRHLQWRPSAVTPYVNTVSVEDEPAYPGDLELEERIASILRWNALAMVVRANRLASELGGHIASYASAADLFEVGFNHFWRGPEARHDSGMRGDDLVFMQAHSAPGIYARAYLEGRLQERDLCFYRREIVARLEGAQGLSSYPHPYLMPDFWQFPTASMGLGPVQSIYQARFMRYLTHRGLLNCEGRRVWGIFGDGEMDEPESMSALTLAAREGLDNLTWVINCNLQRLDGPVRGNGRIIDELETLFTGAGWNVVKLIWGSDWDGLFARDKDGALVQALGNTVDGQMQTFAAKDGRYNRENFFGQSPQLAALVQGLTDEQIDRLKRGGHDMVKIYSAYAAAVSHRGQPTVVLAHTKKGYGMGSAGQGRMTTHSQKKLEDDDLLAFRDRFRLPLSDEQVLNLSFFKPSEDSPEQQYLRSRRQALGGSLPQRRSKCQPIVAPGLETYGDFALKAEGKEMSTTMAFVRLLGGLLKDPRLGPRVVPIVADEARTFGMANLFKQVGIYSSVGQRYSPEDIGSVLSYREARDGQILEEGISEAGAISSWIAAATSYAVHGQAMLPFYIFYSIFGFQRVGDLIWAAADQNPRGFLLGATSGRTTLGGEGLQHQDGSSLVWASTVPNCQSYDPAFAGELAVIIDEGVRLMVQEQRNVFFYVTMTNANYAHPTVDASPEWRSAVLKGASLFQTFGKGGKDLTLLASGAVMTEAQAASERLSSEGYTVHLVSVTSYTQLARDAEVSRSSGALQSSHLHALLARTKGPLVALSDYVRLLPEQIRAYLPEGRSLSVLGTDGFGCSDSRAALRRHFGVDAQAIVSLVRGGLPQ
ncbi:MAG: pyruvate dehydrogenase (acetyl-transferring), homodimeric type [Betaproteobacteria bacterium]|nr:pyruvate dehydrogenase (acetyl-transferring), homodimeric type [Betaproteobacteria bacterium]